METATLKIKVEIVLEGPAQHVQEAAKNFAERADKFVLAESTIGPWKPLARKSSVEILKP
jgi:hypothetical protein